jgi:hypothetical protein
MLTIQYIPYGQIELLDKDKKIAFILEILKDKKIVLIDGRLDSVEEAMLIRETMNSIDENFNGVEIGVLHNHNKKGLIMRLKHHIAKMLIGDRNGITLIGPAQIISELRAHPEKIELSFQKEYLDKNLKASRIVMNDEIATSEDNITQESKEQELAITKKIINKKLKPKNSIKKKNQKITLKIRKK